MPTPTPAPGPAEPRTARVPAAAHAPADADYGCVDWFQYQEAAHEDALATRLKVRASARSALVAARLGALSALGEGTALRRA